MIYFVCVYMCVYTCVLMCVYVYGGMLLLASHAVCPMTATVTCALKAQRRPRMSKKCVPVLCSLRSVFLALPSVSDQKFSLLIFWLLRLAF